MASEKRMNRRLIDWGPHGRKEVVLASEAEAAINAAVKQEREQILAVVDDERLVGGMFTAAKAVHNRAIDDAINAIRSEPDNGE